VEDAYSLIVHCRLH